MQYEDENHNGQMKGWTYGWQTSPFYADDLLAPAVDVSAEFFSKEL